MTTKTTTTRPTTTRTRTTTTRTRTRTRTRRRTRSNNNNDDNEDAARSMSCPQVQMKSPSLFPSPDPYRHRRCAKLYNIQISPNAPAILAGWVHSLNLGEAAALDCTGTILRRLRVRKTELSLLSEALTYHDGHKRRSAAFTQMVWKFCPKHMAKWSIWL